MEHIDIVLNGVLKSDIDKLIKTSLNINKEDIINSHFFTLEKGDFEYSSNINLLDYFSSERTCNIMLSFIKLNKFYENVILVITSDKNDISITINVDITQFKVNEMNSLMSFFKDIYRNYNLSCVYIGIEGVTIKDAHIIINKNGVNINSDNSFYLDR